MQEIQVRCLIGKIPHALEQLSPCIRTVEPVLSSLGTTTSESRATELKPARPRAPAAKKGHHNESPRAAAREQPSLTAAREKPAPSTQT